MAENAKQYQLASNQYVQPAARRSNGVNENENGMAAQSVAYAEGETVESGPQRQRKIGVAALGSAEI